MKLIKDFFALIGAVAVAMFLLGYTYASAPLPKTCTPSFIDRMLK
jgi:hypothetical protein